MTDTAALTRIAVPKLESCISAKSLESKLSMAYTAEREE